jgi:hypothetical protein
MKTEKQIMIIREKYPVAFDELCLHSSFEQILGGEKDDYSPVERKRRWDKVMSFNKRVKQRWADTEMCVGCIHLDEKEAWCGLQELPCTVNPVLSFRCGETGMACCGAGKVKREPELFDDEIF